MDSAPCNASRPGRCSAAASRARLRRRTDLSMPRPLTGRQLAGAAAETAACELLATNGLQCLARNARYPFGELDLVMLDAATLVFVEVRYRSKAGFGGGAASVD